MQCFFHIITTKAAAALQTAAADFKLRKGEESLLPPGLHAGIIWRAICKKMVRGKPHIQHQIIKKTAAVDTHCRSRFSASKAATTPYLQSRTFKPFQQVSWLTHHKSQTSSSRKNPMTGFHPLSGPPRLQWRYRSGVAPDSLFSSQAQPARKH